MNYFDLFGFHRTFDIDKTQLTAEYKNLQRKFHPDRFVHGSEVERSRALVEASRVNLAYQTLSDPVSRAEYILSLQGIEVNAEQRIVRDEIFLMEQLALRESLEEIEESPDVENKLAEFASHLDARVQQLITQMRESLNTHQWQSASDTVSKLRFFVKLQQQVEQLDDRLLGGD